MANMLGVILAGHCAPATGIAGPGRRLFRVDLRKGWIERGEVLFIKPKP